MKWVEDLDREMHEQRFFLDSPAQQRGGTILLIRKATIEAVYQYIGVKPTGHRPTQCHGCFQGIILDKSLARDHSRYQFLLSFADVTALSADMPAVFARARAFFAGTLRLTIRCRTERKISLDSGDSPTARAMIKAP